MLAPISENWWKKFDNLSGNRILEAREALGCKYPNKNEVVRRSGGSKEIQTKAPDS